MANLKMGTLIGGNQIWHSGNMPLDASDTKLLFRDFEVYHEGHKPTPAEVGAVAKTGDTMTGNLTIHTVGANTFTLRTNINQTSRFVMGEDDVDPLRHGFYINYHGGGDNNTVFGTRHGGTDIEAFRISRGVTSVLFAQCPRVTGAQSGNSNALTRKDYVNAEDNLRARKTGDTFTGRVIHNYTSSIKIPTGTTAQRGADEDGSIRFNSEKVIFEGHNGNKWVALGENRDYTVITASRTADANAAYMVDTTKTNIVVTLPTAIDGDYVVVGDWAGNAGTNPFKVVGFNSDTLVVDRDNVVLRFGYTNGKWKIIDGIGETGAIPSGKFMPYAGGTFTGSVDFTEGAHVYTRTNSRPLTIGRHDHDRSEVVKMGVDDAVFHQHYINDEYASTIRWRMQNTDAEGGGGSRASDRTMNLFSNNVEMRLNIDGGDVYTTKRKPSASDVNAVAKTGDTMTGELKVPTIQLTTRGAAGITNADRNNMIRYGGGGSTVVGHFGENSETVIDSFNQPKVRVNGESTTYAIYHEGHKPTPAEIGAVNKAGDTMTGALTATQLNVTPNASLRYGIGNIYGFSFQYPQYSSAITLNQGGINQAFVFGDTSSGNTDTLFGVSVRNSSSSPYSKKLNLTGKGDLYIGTEGTNRVYHTGYKPTPADIGALAVNGKAVDSDKLDGLDSTAFVKKAGDTMTGALIMSGENAKLFVARQRTGSTTPTIDLAIGDNDTGFNYTADGSMDMYANNVSIANFTSSKITFKKATEFNQGLTVKDGGFAVDNPTGVTSMDTPWQNMFIQAQSGSGTAGSPIPTDDTWWWGLSTGHSSNHADYRYGLQLVIRNDSPNQSYIRSRGQNGTGTWQQIYTSTNKQLPWEKVGENTVANSSTDMHLGDITGDNFEMRIEVSGWNDAKTETCGATITVNCFNGKLDASSVPTRYVGSYSGYDFRITKDGSKWVMYFDAMADVDNTKFEYFVSSTNKPATITILPTPVTKSITGTLFGYCSSIFVGANNSREYWVGSCSGSSGSSAALSGRADYDMLPDDSSYRGYTCYAQNRRDYWLQDTHPDTGDVVDNLFIKGNDVTGFTGINSLSFSKKNDGKVELWQANEGDKKWTVKGTIYHTGNKPTPAEVGALPASGKAVDSAKADYITAVDDRDVKPNTTGISDGVKGVKAFFVSNSTFPSGIGGSYTDLLVMDTYGDSSGGSMNALAFSKQSNALYHIQSGFDAATWGTPRKIYTTAQKPTPAEVGAVNKAGDTMTGKLTISSNAAGEGLYINTGSRNGGGALIKFTDLQNAGTDQYGTLGYFHVNSATYGGDDAFIVDSNQSKTNFVLKGTGNFKVENNAVYHEGSSIDLGTY